MSEISNSAIEKVQNSKLAFCRFITTNDTGKNCSHQAGFYIPKCAASLLFDTPGEKGKNKDKYVEIKWQDTFSTNSRFIYYGQGTRNEYRITRFGKDFPFFEEDNVGDLLIIAQYTSENYVGYVLQSDEDIEQFFAYFNLSPTETNQLVDIKGFEQPDEKLERLLRAFVDKFENFPETMRMACGAQECYNEAYATSNNRCIRDPDEILLKWIETEYRLFKCMEEKIYGDMLCHPISSIDIFIQKANEVLNRRKSRAGKSLEHHLAKIFTENSLVFQEQVVTEENKKPDFVFPNGKCYHDILFPANELIMLGAKTTCKDRWRQILTEADRIAAKFLFTLQQGVSKNQLKEMVASGLTLVVPDSYVKYFPIEYQCTIKNLRSFVQMVKEKQMHLPNHYLVL